MKGFLMSVVRGMLVTTLAWSAGCTTTGVLDSNEPEDTGDTDDTTDTADTDDTDEVKPQEPPTVTRAATYTFKKTEAVVYAQGIVDANWGERPGTERDLVLDLWEPVDTDGSKRPALMFIHGGAFVGGSRTHEPIVALCESFASRGWVTASIDYRLRDDAGPVPQAWADAADAFPNAGQVRAMYLAARDGRAALRWMTANAETLNIDPDYVAVGGGSAGAYTAVAVGVSGPDDYLNELTVDEDPTLASTHPTAPVAVQAVLDFWGGASIPLISERIDGTSRFDAADPAIAVIHGTEDPTVPYDEATRLVTLYEETSPVRAVSAGGKGHGPWGARIEGQSLAEVSFDFLVVHQGLKVME